MTENIITQVSQDESPVIQQHTQEDSIDYNSKINLNIRGKHFTITRDELMSLPESILLCLFPNGVFLDAHGQVITSLTEEDVVYVNFSPETFEYIINTFNEAQHDLHESAPLSPQSSGHKFFQDNNANVLQNKPAIIVLREDLDFYVIPPVAGLTADQIRQLKLSAAHEITSNKHIFSGLGYDTNVLWPQEQKLGPAEQHLFDMLCSSGFDPRGSWGTRNLEPSRCMVSSLSLVRLKTHSQHSPPESPSLKPVESNASSASRSRSRWASLASGATRAASRSLSRNSKQQDVNHSKLLLFWRKPARKCWWTSQTVHINSKDIIKGKDSFDIKVHIRRVWTLELSIVGVQ
ncbi:Piso0_002312 [Millerozyma farinosa CBS 7064]|uniref:Piso0_002312 protein n=1 Tax=Pichia sorbitophila (strain ATCC MYA-4447 / BCRC 22081 / CBS 7064 / NBRC 10061 / NRRL Y-12695) TaxID=559304 RepID=G8YEQ1_PICSO|nr:Piso0_002312 [Millerozyma farinosa CBS 7064]